MNTTISEADGEPRHISDVLRNWWACAAERGILLDNGESRGDDNQRLLQQSPLAPGGSSRRQGPLSKIS